MSSDHEHDFNETLLSGFLDEASDAARHSAGSTASRDLFRVR